MISHTKSILIFSRAANANYKRKGNLANFSTVLLQTTVAAFRLYHFAYKMIKKSSKETIRRPT